MVKACDEDEVLCEACESPEFLVYWDGGVVLIECMDCGAERLLI